MTDRELIAQLRERIAKGNPPPGYVAQLAALERHVRSAVNMPGGVCKPHRIEMSDWKPWKKPPKNSLDTAEE